MESNKLSDLGKTTRQVDTLPIATNHFLFPQFCRGVDYHEGH